MIVMALLKSHISTAVDTLEWFVSLLHSHLCTKLNDLNIPKILVIMRAYYYNEDAVRTLHHLPLTTFHTDTLPG